VNRELHAIAANLREQPIERLRGISLHVREHVGVSDVIAIVSARGDRSRSSGVFRTRSIEVAAV